MFYLNDLLHRDAWKVVNHVVQRNIYSAATLGVCGDDEEDSVYQEPNAIGILDSSTIRVNNVRPGRVVRIRDDEIRLIDVDLNDNNQDSEDEDRHIVPELNSDTDVDSSVDLSDSDYEP